MNGVVVVSRTAPHEENARFTAVNNTSSSGNGVPHRRPVGPPLNTSPKSARPHEDWQQQHNIVEHPNKRKRSLEPVAQPQPTNPYSQSHMQTAQIPPQRPTLLQPPQHAPHGIEAPIETEETKPTRESTEDSSSERGKLVSVDDTQMSDVREAGAAEAGSSNATGVVEGGSEQKKQRKRQFANRTKTGCITCRRRKKKCDEGKPECEYHPVEVLNTQETVLGYLETCGSELCVSFRYSIL